jgi:hypothetical protein
MTGPPAVSGVDMQRTGKSYFVSMQDQFGFVQTRILSSKETTEK